MGNSRLWRLNLFVLSNQNKSLVEEEGRSTRARATLFKLVETVKTREQLEEKYILKEKDLLNDDGKIDDVRVKQNEESYEIFNLYCWWKHERPKRKDHYEELLKKHPREKKFQHIPIEWDEEGEPTLYRWDSGMSSEFAEDMRKVADLERFEYEEDTQKLKRLVELRERIWR